MTLMNITEITNWMEHMCSYISSHNLSHKANTHSFLYFAHLFPQYDMNTIPIVFEIKKDINMDQLYTPKLVIQCNIDLYIPYYLKRIQQFKKSSNIVMKNKYSKFLVCKLPAMKYYLLFSFSFNFNYLYIILLWYIYSVEDRKYSDILHKLYFPGKL